MAWLNPGMWTELFLENRDTLINALDFLIDELGKYRVALIEQDAPELERLLDEGRMRKKEIDGR